MLIYVVVPTARPSKKNKYNILEKYHRGKKEELIAKGVQVEGESFGDVIP